MHSDQTDQSQLRLHESLQCLVIFWEGARQDTVGGGRVGYIPIQHIDNTE